VKTMFPGTYAQPKYLEGASKECGTCGVIKPFYEFGLQNRHRKKPSRKAACRACEQVARRARGSSALGPKIGVKNWNDG
jgi:hypothetical protein